MSFIYKLHFELALGMWGIWMLGVTALIWTIDCFIGFYLTLPANQKSVSGDSPPIAPASRARNGAVGSRRPWWSRWMDSWKVKWRGSSFRINFDLHRAGGLWLWAALLVFAWQRLHEPVGHRLYLGDARGA